MLIEPINNEHITKDLEGQPEMFDRISPPWLDRILQDVSREKSLVYIQSQYLAASAYLHNFIYAFIDT